MTEKKDSTCSTCEQQQFTEHLEQASQIVRSWPLWKQTVLGGHETASTGREQASSSGSMQVSGDSTSQCR